MNGMLTSHSLTPFANANIIPSIKEEIDRRIAQLPTGLGDYGVRLYLTHLFGDQLWRATGRKW